MAAPRAKTVPLAGIAALFGVSTETIRLWRKAGMPSRVQSGAPAFVPTECIKWRREKDREDRVVADDNGKEDRLRILRADAELRELELQERSGLLVPRADYEAELDRFVGGLVAAVSGRLQQFERDIVQATTAQLARALTEKIQDEVLRATREYADQIEAEPSEGDSESDPPSDEEAA